MEYTCRTGSAGGTTTRRAREAVEKAMGKSLPLNAEIHHVNGNASIYNNSNLVACEDHAYHMLLHMRTRALIACGHADWKKCSYCKEYDLPENLWVGKGGRCLHRKCIKQRNREYQEKQIQKNAQIYALLGELAKDLGEIYAEA